MSSLQFPEDNLTNKTQGYSFIPLPVTNMGATYYRPWKKLLLANSRPHAMEEHTSPSSPPSPVYTHLSVFPMPTHPYLNRNNHKRIQPRPSTTGSKERITLGTSNCSYTVKKPSGSTTPPMTSYHDTDIPVMDGKKVMLFIRGTYLPATVTPLGHRSDETQVVRVKEEEQRRKKIRNRIRYGQI